MNNNTFAGGWKGRHSAKRVGLMRRSREADRDRESAPLQKDDDLPLFEKLREELIEDLTRKRELEP